MFFPFRRYRRADTTPVFLNHDENETNNSEITETTANNNSSSFHQHETKTITTTTAMSLKKIITNFFSIPNKCLFRNLARRLVWRDVPKLLFEKLTNFFSFFYFLFFFLFESSGCTNHEFSQIMTAASTKTVTNESSSNSHNLKQQSAHDLALDTDVERKQITVSKDKKKLLFQKIAWLFFSF